MINIHRETDPTRTKTLRDAFEADLNKRFRDLRGSIRKAIDDRDVFALKENVEVPSARAFNFPRDKEKVQEFMNWLNKMADRGIFGLSEGVSRTQASEVAWANTYIDSSYRQGIRRANQELRNANYPVSALSDEGVRITFSQPIHADRAGLIYTRVYRELKGITDAMDQQISRILAQGMVEGRSPIEMANEITKQVQTIQRQRAVKLARTEVIRAHHEATMNMYKEAEVEGVVMMAEWSTAGDHRVCSLCQSYAEAGPYDLDDVWGLVPVHSLCRCMVLPLTLGDVEMEMGI